MSKKKEIKLKKCPFKHPAKYGKKQTVSIREQALKYVKCSICGACGPEALTKYWAVKKWNERTR